MIVAAFIDLELIPREDILEILECAGNVMADTEISINEVRVKRQKALRMDVKCEQLENISGKELIGFLERAIELTELDMNGVKIARNIISTILEAEMIVHETTIDDLHLHETGSPDTLVDAIGIAYFYEKLRLYDESILATPISVGEGTIRIAHGEVSVPAPATAKILEGMQCKSGPVKGELATPTGVAIMKNLVNEFMLDKKEMFMYVPNNIGNSTGTRTFGKDFESILRVIYCENRN